MIKPRPELWRHDATELAELLASRTISATALLDHFFARIEKLNPRLNAFVHINAAAEQEATESDKRRAAGRLLSPIDGLPVALKDNLVVKGMPCTWGSRLFADYVPEHDEIPIARLRGLGVVILGKTNVPEFTLEGYTGNDLFGVTGNPWNPKLTPGGSSGGSVAAVSCGLAPLAFGTDGGGSIRRPAAYTGLVGLKPSIGRIARGRGLPQLLLDFEVIGLISRTVRDCSMIYELMAGADPRDHRSMLFCNDAQPRAKHLRILYVERLGDAPLDRQIAERVDQAITTLDGLGHHVERGKLPLSIEAINEFWPKIGQFSLAKMLADYQDMASKAAGKYVAMAKTGQSLSAETVHHGLETTWALRDAASEVFQRYDIIMTPTCAAMPWPAEEAFPETIDGQSVGPRGHAIYTGWVNACGHPAIALPAMPAENDMPVGFQLVAGFGQEALLFDIAAAYENQNPWSGRWPAMAVLSH